MPITFPVLPSRPVNATHSYTLDNGGGVAASVSVGTNIYVANIDSPAGPFGAFFSSLWGSPAMNLALRTSPSLTAVSTLTNAGTIRSYSTVYGAVGTFSGTITNSGWIIAESILPASPSGSGYNYAYAAAVRSVVNLTNSGNVYAAASGTAVGVSTVTGSTITNTGTISARATIAPDASGGLGIGIEATEVGVSVTNELSGKILVDGPQARGLQFFHGHQDPNLIALTNHGLIEVEASAVGARSVGVFAGHLPGEYFTIVNDGTIKASIAIYGADTPGSDLPGSGLPYQNVEVVQNLTGGVIQGDILLRLGDDELFNAGTITGLVDTGEGWDYVDSIGGTINGRVELGTGNDTFQGGSNADVARGGFGDDQILGGAGADLLIGDGNDDALAGEAGNDGMYGGTGNDTFFTLEGDRVVGGAGNDQIVAGDYNFALIDGGTGHDIWKLPEGTRRIDLATVASSGRVTGIDEMEIGSSKTLTIRSANVTSLSDSSTLRISNASGSSVYLPETWTAGSNVVINGQTYLQYTRSGVTLLIHNAATVNAGSSPSPAGSGLDAIAGGTAAPLAGSVAGTTVSNEYNSNAGLRFSESQVIDAGLTVRSTNGAYAATTLGLDGILVLTNNGSIVGEGTTQAGGLSDGLAITLNNNGTISATASAGRATAVSLAAVATVQNASQISATGSDGAIGIDFLGTNSVTLSNSGTIAAQAGGSATGPEIGVRLKNGTVSNTGTIDAAIAVQFNGTGNNILTNRGTIVGIVQFGSGNDLCDTVGGTISGGVSGGAGNDLYKLDSQSIVIYEGVGGGTDTVESTVGYYLYANVENLALKAGSGSIFGVGTSTANILTGNEGANLLLGGGGDDTLNGGTGGDSLFGEDGADTLNGDAGIDYLVGGTGNDTLNGGDQADAIYGEDGDDLLDGGNSFDTDILVGGAGNDTLDGISGQANPEYDLMDGGAGNDTYWVDTGADLTFEAVGGGIDTVHANVTVPNAGVYLYANVENLVLEGTTAFGVGNELDNQLTGSASGNWLLGYLGNDIIAGMGGNDVLFGEGGADTFVFGSGSGADVIGDFQHGVDKIQLNGIYSNFQSVQNSFHQNGSDGAIDLGGGNLIVLLGVDLSTLTASDFIFGEAAEVAPKLAGMSHASSASLPSFGHLGWEGAESDWLSIHQMAGCVA